MKLIRLSLVCSMFFAGTAFAQEALRSMHDDPLYQAKRQMETAELNASLDPLEKAALHTQNAAERLAELRAIAARDRYESADDLLMDYESSIGGAMDEINKAEGQGRDVSKALSSVESSTAKHTEVLNDLLDKVPEEASPAIRHAISVSRHGRNTALDRLERIQSGEMPAGRSEGFGRPEQPERPDRMDRLGRPEMPGGGDRSGGFGGSDGGRSGGGPSGGGRGR